LLVKVTAYNTDSLWLPCRGNLLVYLKDSTQMQKFSRGDKLLIHGRPQRVMPPMNPAAFDYSRYLESQGIGYQCFVNANAFTILEKSQTLTLFSLADNLRLKMLERLRQYLNGPDRLGVGGALLLGYEEWLDPELENQYTAAGVLHILCVSGMHVGLIYIILSWMMAWMNRHKFLRHLRFPILIGFIWFYAMVTGLAPSVIRAATMLIFVIAGKWLSKNSDIYNTLCCSCIVMFIVDPYLLISAGFQLSFLAVCGIVFFHKLIFPLWHAPNLWMHKTWELISISISAQLTTFPLSLYLFHQFPNYFMIGNLLLIPVSTLVMYTGLALLVTGWIPLAGTITGFVTAYAIDLLNFLVNFVSNLPGAVTENIFISMWETILIYVLMIIFAFWVVRKYRSLFLALQLTMAVVLAFRIFYLSEAVSVRQFTVYHHKDQTICSLIENRKALIFADPQLPVKQLKFALGGFFNAMMVKDTMMIGIKDSAIFKIEKEGIILIKNWKKNLTPLIAEDVKPAEVKILVIGGNTTITADTLLKYFYPSIVVFDPSSKSWNSTQLRSDLINSGVPTHQISTDGAFTIKLN
jgi:competence protein ComEC